MSYVRDTLEDGGFTVGGNLGDGEISVKGKSGVKIIIDYMPWYCGGWYLYTNPRALAKAQDDIIKVIDILRDDLLYQIFWTGERGPVTESQGKILSKLGFSQENKVVWVNYGE